jgi:hypothetical protein
MTPMFESNVPGVVELSLKRSTETEPVALVSGVNRSFTSTCVSAKAEPPVEKELYKGPHFVPTSSVPLVEELRLSYKTAAFAGVVRVAVETDKTTTKNNQFAPVYVFALVRFISASMDDAESSD